MKCIVISMLTFKFIREFKPYFFIFLYFYFIGTNLVQKIFLFENGVQILLNTEENFFPKAIRKISPWWALIGHLHGTVWGTTRQKQYKTTCGGKHSVRISPILYTIRRFQNGTVYILMVTRRHSTCVANGKDMRLPPRHWLGINAS